MRYVVRVGGTRLGKEVDLTHAVKDAQNKERYG
jgi:hypothetical protein